VWNTIGISANVIDASFNALHDSVTYKLLHAKNK
jgi:2-isopropylmalate synthase